MTYSLAYLAGVGAKALKLSAAEVPATGDEYGEVLNGLRHILPQRFSVEDAMEDLQNIIASANDLRDAIKESM